MKPPPASRPLTSTRSSHGTNRCIYAPARASSPASWFAARSGTAGKLSMAASARGCKTTYSTARRCRYRRRRRRSVAWRCCWYGWRSTDQPMPVKIAAGRDQSAGVLQKQPTACGSLSGGAWQARIRVRSRRPRIYGCADRRRGGGTFTTGFSQGSALAVSRFRVAALRFNLFWRLPGHHEQRAVGGSRSRAAQVRRNRGPFSLAVCAKHSTV
jgi:hypothetical protein